MEKIHDMFITSGKKNEIITVEGLPANLTEKTGRQIFAKIPGAFIYDMDGSGNQLNLSTRGLDPHRSWELNVRQNGIMTNSDIYGYPASHYSVPLEAVSKIEIIRGSGALQYGAQFGGMINYVLKDPDTTKNFQFENVSSIGSFGLISNYTSIGGRKGKFKYFAYYQKRISKGYRDNANSDSQAQFLSLSFTPNRKITLIAELGRSQYLYQVPGPLTDSMFLQNPRQSTRSRNYFNPDIYVPAITLDWNFSQKTSFRWTTSAVLGQRNSVQFIGFANSPDTINKMTVLYKNRQVDIDNFNSYTSELKLIQHYKVFGYSSIVSSGVRFIHNKLHRRQLGTGSSGFNYDLNVIGSFGRDIFLKTKNIAIFMENVLQLSKYWDITFGIRYENGKSEMEGTISYLDTKDIPKSIVHRYPLLGIGSQIDINPEIVVYGNWSQAYRPVIFADLIPGSVLEKTDITLKDAFGSTAEIGIKGKFKSLLTFDVNVFQMLYKNRIGNQVMADENQNSIILKTNIGDSKTNGIEMYLEAPLFSFKNTTVSLFTSSSYFDAKYTNGSIRNGNFNIDIAGNRLETVPEFISRNGLQLSSNQFSMILQYSYVSSSFSDPANTYIPTQNGTAGKVPSYSIWDINTSYRINNFIRFQFGVNNILDKSYFTKRPAGYPGPGVWSSDGRSYQATLYVKI